MTLRIGLPQWHHANWKQFGIETLADYAQLFSCVEGNTTLYALPKPEVVQRWKEMTHDDFRFCFKFPDSISHKAALRNCDELLNAFFRLLDPLSQRIEQYWLQLPASFSPGQLNDLWAFLDRLPRSFGYGVEVRHQAFFAKGEAERALNRGLQQRGVNRVILDSRPVHASASQSAAAIDARGKKPRVPPHAVRTGAQPMVRFIGSDSVDESVPLFQPWQSKLLEWQTGSNPLLFIHTPDMGEVFPLLQALWPQLQQIEPTLRDLPHWPLQSALF